MLHLTTNNISPFLLLKAGDVLTLSGTVYTARDAAHKRLIQAIAKNEPLPFPLQKTFIYFAGPTPAKPGQPIGSCGPTTSSRMDSFSPALYDQGLFCTIGKGERAEVVRSACKRNRSLYLCAIGGAGALAAKHIIDATVIAYEDLGCESIKKLTFLDFPLTVAIDSEGNDLFERRCKFE